MSPKTNTATTLAAVPPPGGTKTGSSPTSLHGDLAKQLAALQAENAALKATIASRGTSGKLTIKASTSGTGSVCVYGLGRFPVSLYKEQWTKLLDIGEDIRAFITANDSILFGKDDPRRVVAMAEAAARKEAEKAAAGQ